MKNVYSNLLKIKILLIILVIYGACSEQTNTLDIQGHRGCRGLYPENSIPGFIHAVKLGVTTLELDVVISKDKQIVVSHEPFISGEICLGTDGSLIKEAYPDSINIYKLSYAEIKRFDCGSVFNKNFIKQKKTPTYKPLLSEVIDSVENYISRNNLAAVNYNIEIKSSQEGDNIYHPEPPEFAAQLIKVLRQKNISKRTSIQSFDIRSLQAVHAQDRNMKTTYLVDKEPNFRANIKKLGFKPDYYSPYFPLVNDKLVAYTKKKKIKLVPWTVNEVNEMKYMIELGVDGIITDYPDRLIELLNE